jgi:membrane-associated phospholipid phosphatase
MWAGLHGLLAVAVPTLYIVWLVQRGEVSDLHLRVRAERIRPLLVSLATGAASLAVLHFAGAPRLFVLLAALNLVQLAIFLCITLRWKISAHCAAAAGLTVLGWNLLGDGGAFIAPIVPLIAWARVYLSRHTPSQTVAGTALGTGLWIAALLVYGG